MSVAVSKWARMLGARSGIQQVYVVRWRGRWNIQAGFVGQYRFQIPLLWSRGPYPFPKELPGFRQINHETMIGIICRQQGRGALGDTQSDCVALGDVQRPLSSAEP